MQTITLNQPRPYLKTEFKLCPYCYSENQEFISQDNGEMRIRCEDCKKEYYQSPNAQWQKFCIVCGAYIDWRSEDCTGCLCKGREKK